MTDHRSPAPPRLTVEFHIPISPTPDFLIRVHYVAASIALNSGLEPSAYRIVVTVGAEAVEDLDQRCPWAGLYPLEWRWVEPSTFRRSSYYATAVERFRYDMRADVGVLLDGDVFVCRPLDGWLADVARDGALHGMPAHFSPFYDPPPPKPHRESWETMFREAGLPVPAFDMQHLGWGIIHANVPEESGMRWGPTYFNLGVLAARPAVLAAVGSSIYDDMAAADRFYPTHFKCQIALALSIARHGIHASRLPARYNFLNTPEMFDSLQEDAADIRIFHLNQPSEIHKGIDFATYGCVQRALRRTGLHPVNRALLDQLQKIHYGRVVDDLQKTGMAKIVEPEADYLQVQRAIRSARMFVDEGRIQDAYDILVPLQDFLEDEAHAQYLLGFTKHVLGGDRNAALRHYSNALRCGFDEFWVRYNRGALSRDLGMRAQAAQDLARAQALRPDHPGIEELRAALDA